MKSRLVSSWLCRNKEQFKLSKSFVNETPDGNSEKFVLSDENMNLSLLDKYQDGPSFAINVSQHF